MNWPLIAGLLVAAAASIWNVISFKLEHLWAPSSHLMDFTLLGSIVEIFILVIGALVLVWRGKNSARWLVFATVLTLTVGFAPRILDATENRIALSMRLVDDRQIESKLLSDIEARKQDVEARIAAKRPYSPAESLRLVDFVGDSDLSFRSLPDHSDTTFVLLQRALEGKILDPNTLVKGPRPVDVSSEPLFLYFYRATVRPTPQSRIRNRDWRVLQLLVAAGANLTVAGAAPLVDDLRKTPKPIANNREYIELN